MTLVWHIVRKDLRHTWMFAAAALGLLLVCVWNFGRVLQAGRGEQYRFLEVQLSVDILTIAAWGLFCGVLLHAEALPGTRQHWLVRPIRWQHLLGAKSLLIAALLIVPVALLHCALLASRGFPPLEHLAPIAWNSSLLVIVCVLPAAVLASISRNLQQLILWLLGTAGGVLLIRQFITGFPDDLRWVTNSVAVLLGVTSGIAFLIWQYSSRRTGAGRVVVIAVCLILATLEYWPIRTWYAVQRAASPTRVTDDTAQIRVHEPGLGWNPFRIEGFIGRANTLEVPVRIEGLPAGATVELNGYSSFSIRSGTEQLRHGAISNSPNLTKGQIFILINPDFAGRHRTDPIDIDIAAELTVYAAPVHRSMPVEGDVVVPNLGRCRNGVSEGGLLIDCQAVFGLRSRLRGYWANGVPAANSPQVLSEVEDRSPLTIIPVLHPISLLRGHFGAQSGYEGKAIVLAFQTPIAHVQRKIELRGIRLSEITD
jgi:hypothetical protein